MSEKAANVERNPLKDPQKAWRTIAQKDWVDQDFYTLMCTPYISTYTHVSMLMIQLKQLMNKI